MAAIRTPRILTTPSAVNAAVKDICNVLRRSNCAGAMQYVPELTWILFLRILDERERREEQEAVAVGDTFVPSLSAPYRWQDWGDPAGAKRLALTGDGSSGGDVFTFVNDDLLPHLRALDDQEDSTARQRVIAQIMSSVERTKVDTEQNFLDVVDRVHVISAERMDTTHVFPLSQVYEGLLLDLGEKNNDGGQFFTPRAVIRTMVEALRPKLKDTVYDPCCGTGGFLAQAVEYMAENLGSAATSDDLIHLKTKTIYGREKDDQIYPIALANLVLHGIDEPHIWHGNTLTERPTYDGLYEDAPATFDVVLTNPPFGGKEGEAAQRLFPYKTGATQILFLQHVIESVKPGGRGAIVLDEGALYRSNDAAFVQTRRKLLDECEVDAVLSLPAGVFSSAGTSGTKTSVVFFTKGKRTERVWFYDLSNVKVGKTRPLTHDSLDGFLQLLPTKAASARSWTVDRQTIDDNDAVLKAIDPRAAVQEARATSAEILAAMREDYDRLGVILEELDATLTGNGKA